MRNGRRLAVVQVDAACRCGRGRDHGVVLAVGLALLAHAPIGRVQLWRVVQVGGELGVAVAGRQGRWHAGQIAQTRRGERVRCRRRQGRTIRRAFHDQTFAGTGNVAPTDNDKHRY